VAVQEVTWDGGNSQPADDYIFFHRNENATRRRDFRTKVN